MYTLFEGANCLVLRHILHSMMKGGPPLDIIPQSFIRFLETVLQLSQTSWSFASALESLDEYPSQLFPTEDTSRGQLSQPSSSRALKHQWEVLHGHLVITSTNLNGHSVVFQPSVRLRLTGKLAHACSQSEIGRNLSGSNSPAETLKP